MFSCVLGGILFICLLVAARRSYFSVDDWKEFITLYRNIQFSIFSIDCGTSVMSFVDLATLTLHRRHEMETRISTFAGKCDQAINNIRKLKTQARTFVNHLNCEPSELKERFLACMKKLDEYIYLMTEFNLSIDNLERNESMELAPVHDNSYKNYPVLTPTNLMDVLSEPSTAPTTSTACANMCPAERPHGRRRPKREQLLIAFSSTSCSAESVGNGSIGAGVGNGSRGGVNPTVEKEVQCVAEEMEDLNITDLKAMVTLPQQAILDTDSSYEAAIMSIDGSTFWIVADQADDAYHLLRDLKEYYSDEKNRVSVCLDDLPDFTCCVYYDEEDTQGYYRAMFLRAAEGTNRKEEVFLVDTGEQRTVTEDCLQPLLPRFRTAPPYAHCCHLADVEFLSTKTEELEEFLKQFLWKSFTMKIDDNSSESLGVYIYLDEEKTLNELLVQEGLATPLDKPARPKPPAPARGPPSLQSCSEHDYSGPEHDDPVEAITGYHNRDEADICKHYTGGSEKTCFKGNRCKKRHVMKHPDGWTLDRVSTPKCRPPVLPAPGSWHKVLVVYVCHFDRVYVHFQQDSVREELPTFGVVLPPATLSALVRDMNSPATRAAYRPLKLAPAPGELVAARYRDGLYYRARVIVSTPADQNVEVMYIDYGNIISVKENELMELNGRFTVLPTQAVLCRLAGLTKLSECPKTWAQAKQNLADIAQDQTMHAHIISRGYDELTVELVDGAGACLAAALAAAAPAAVAYRRDYSVDTDADADTRRFQLVQP